MAELAACKDTSKQAESADESSAASPAAMEISRVPSLGGPAELGDAGSLWQALCECEAVAGAAGATEPKRSRIDTPAPASTGHAQRQRPHRPPRPPKADPRSNSTLRATRRDRAARHHGPPRPPPPRRGQRRAQLIVRPASFLPRAVDASPPRHAIDATPPRRAVDATRRAPSTRHTTAGSTARRRRRRGRLHWHTTPPSSRRCSARASAARPRPSRTSSS